MQLWKEKTTNASLPLTVQELQAELAKRLVAMEIPDRSERTALKIKEAEKSVPIPERVWALRNVGETSAMGGKDGQNRARTLLERALLLKEEFVGSSKHPGRDSYSILDGPSKFEQLAVRLNSNRALQRSQKYLSRDVSASINMTFNDLDFEGSQ